MVQPGHIFWRNLFMTGFFAATLYARGDVLKLPGRPTLLLVAAAAFLMPLLGRITYIEALRRAPISRVALITQATPFFAAFFAFLLLRSQPTLIEWAGGILILVGVLVVRLQARTAPPG